MLNKKQVLEARPIPSTASTDIVDGYPICVYCDKRLRWYINGWGYAGSGHFCNMKCAAEWGDRKVVGTS